MELRDLTVNGRAIFLAYDQGIEHGPTDFNEQNVDPSYILEIGIKGGFNAIVLQKGVAEKYYEGKIPLILKLNGKTNLSKEEAISRQICTVEEAVSLGAKAVGYTIYIGSAFESVMLQEFSQIQKEAHERRLPVIAWIYPRGKGISNDTARDVVAYASRVGLEVGADAVKVKYTGDSESFRWAVRSAGKIKVFVAGGPKTSTDEEFLEHIRGAMVAGAAGVAVGRNIWQSDDPLKIAAKLREAVFGLSTYAKISPV